MPGADELIYNNLERALSTDLNNTQSLKDRVLLDALQRKYSPIIHPGAFGSVPTSSPRAVVLGGLEVIPNGNDITVQPGVLLQDSATLAPVPGARDSDYRIGINRLGESVTMPAPGADSWVVVEASMARVVTINVSRDIFNPGTGLFVPTAVDKEAERQLDFTIVTTPATVPAFTGGDVIPIAIVRRPAGGGAVLASDIYDIRPMWQNRMARGGEEIPNVSISAGRRGPVSMFTESFFGVAGASDNITINHAVAFTKEGERLWIASDTAFDPLQDPVQETGFATIADTWFYLYLAPFRSLAIRNWMGATLGVDLQGNGMLILSAVVPDARGLNSGALTPSAPFSATPGIAAGDAVLVTPLRRNSADTGWDGLYTADGHLFRTAGQAAFTSLAPPVLGDNALAPGTSAPAGTRSLLIGIFWTGAAGANSFHVGAPQRTGGAIALDQSIGINDAEESSYRYELAVQALAGTGHDFNISGPGVNAGTAASFSVIGFRL